MKNGMTLLELIVTLVIITFVVALMLPSYNRSQERALDKEAFGNLKRIQEAQKFYNMEAGQGSSYYYPSAGTTSNTSNINLYLRLSLPIVATPNWVYSVEDTGCGQATRNGSDSRVWHLEMTDSGDGPTFPSAACP